MYYSAQDFDGVNWLISSHPKIQNGMSMWECTCYSKGQPSTMNVNLTALQTTFGRDILEKMLKEAYNSGDKTNG